MASIGIPTPGQVIADMQRLQTGFDKGEVTAQKAAVWHTAYVSRFESILNTYRADETIKNGLRSSFYTVSQPLFERITIASASSSQDKENSPHMPVIPTGIALPRPREQSAADIERLKKTEEEQRRRLSEVAESHRQDVLNTKRQSEVDTNPKAPAVDQPVDAPAAQAQESVDPSVHKVRIPRNRKKAPAKPSDQPKAEPERFPLASLKNFSTLHSSLEPHQPSLKPPFEPPKQSYNTGILQINQMKFLSQNLKDTPFIQAAEAFTGIAGKFQIINRLDSEEDSEMKRSLFRKHALPACIQIVEKVPSELEARKISIADATQKSYNVLKPMKDLILAPRSFATEEDHDDYCDEKDAFDDAKRKVAHEIAQFHAKNAYSDYLLFGKKEQQAVQERPRISIFGKNRFRRDSSVSISSGRDKAPTVAEAAQSSSSAATAPVQVAQLSPTVVALPEQLTQEPTPTVAAQAPQTVRLSVFARSGRDRAQTVPSAAQSSSSVAVVQEQVAQSPATPTVAVATQSPPSVGAQAQTPTGAPAVPKTTRFRFDRDRPV